MCCLNFLRVKNCFLAFLLIGNVVKGNGVGMTEEQLNSIFEPFFTSKSKGFGIGLTASQTIIFNHGGNIDVRSELNEGTTFIVSIPI